MERKILKFIQEQKWGLLASIVFILLRMLYLGLRTESVTGTVINMGYESSLRIEHREIVRYYGMSSMPSCAIDPRSNIVTRVSTEINSKGESVTVSRLDTEYDYSELTWKFHSKLDTTVYCLQSTLYPTYPKNPVSTSNNYRWTKNIQYFATVESLDKRSIKKLYITPEQHLRLIKGSTISISRRRQSKNIVEIK